MSLIELMEDSLFALFFIRNIDMKKIIQILHEHLVLQLWISWISMEALCSDMVKFMQFFNLCEITDIFIVMPQALRFSNLI